MKLEKLLLAGCLLSSVAHARTLADLETFCNGMGKGVTDEAAAPIVQAAREHITAAKLSDGKPVPAETAEELKQPILPSNISTCIVRVAGTSALASVCGIDYEERVLDPFMKLFREAFKPSDKQAAFAGLLHGVAFGAQEQSMKAMAPKAGPCPDWAKKQIDQTLPKKR